jgi:type I phosphodiesterase/nucleotide pyrophosphatase
MAYHPPKLPWIKDEDFALYKDVVKGAYRFHDMMLERLLELAGPETTVILCSDHGFESGSQRPHGTPREPALGGDPGKIGFLHSWRLVITKAVIWRRRNVCYSQSPMVRSWARLG